MAPLTLKLMLETSQPQVHSNGPKNQKELSEGGDWTMKGYHALIKTERWKKNDGADFVFFDPHPGFTDGTSDKDFKILMCETSKKSMHIVVERGQINICQVAHLGLTQFLHSG